MRSSIVIEAMPFEGTPSRKIELLIADTEQRTSCSLNGLIEHFAADPHSKPRDPTYSTSRCFAEFLNSIGLVLIRPKSPTQEDIDRQIEAERVEAAGAWGRLPVQARPSCDWVTWQHIERNVYRIVRGEARPW